MQIRLIYTVETAWVLGCKYEYYRCVETKKLNFSLPNHRVSSWYDLAHSPCVYGGYGVVVGTVTLLAFS